MNLSSAWPALQRPVRGNLMAQALLSRAEHARQYRERKGRLAVLCAQVSFVLSCLALAFVAAAYVFTRSRPVYLLNFHTFKPPAQ